MDRDTGGFTGGVKTRDDLVLAVLSEMSECKYYGGKFITNLINGKDLTGEVGWDTTHYKDRSDLKS